MINLTELETDCLRAMYYSEYNDRGCDSLPCIWSFSVADNAKITKKEQVCGVISSLVKKGIVGCDGDGTDQDPKTVSVISEEAHQFAKDNGWCLP